jgi:hypothetical protein
MPEEYAKGGVLPPAMAWHRNTGGPERVLTLEQLHQRGHHVQHAHGRRVSVEYAERFDASTDAHGGAMVALMPSAADAKRLALKGGEAAAELHCTLWFLGGDAAVWDEHMRSELTANLTSMAHAGLFGGPVTSKVFGIAHWNAGGKAPSWVWSVGDDPDADTVDCPLDTAHGLVCEALENLHEQPDGMPSQHTPWVAHICAAYTDDLTLARELEKRNGPVTFDRIRVSFGDQNTDIPLTAPVTAAASHRGEFRRGLTDAETASRIDFAGHQRGWKQAVDAAMRDWSGVTADWRNQIKAQLAAGDVADSLDGLHVDAVTAAQLLYDRMQNAAMAAGRAQQRAAEEQGVTVPPWDLDGPLTASLISRLRQLRLIARTTADTQASRLVDSAKRTAVPLTRVFSGIRLASEVDQHLAGLSDAYAREGLGQALSEAQAAGQGAVLEAAPTATYYATEILDDRVCQPCREVDGKAFSSLDDADTAYPGGGYADCAGGGNCRGQIVAVWDQGMTAAAEETAMTTAAELGGKPNQGTKRDRRLRRNAMTGEAPCGTCPDDAEHFEAPLVELAWDGAASRFTDPEYREAAAACDTGSGTVKERCFLPHHDPGGALNRDGLAAAAGRVGSLSGHSAAAVAKAKAHLRSHYSSIGEPVPDSLKAAVQPGAPAPAQPKCPPGWSKDPDHDGCLPPDHVPGSRVECPDGWGPDDDGDGCVPVMTAAATAPESTEIPAGAQTAPWNGVLAVEGITTGDGREFAPDALTWRDLPVPLRWNKEDSHGGAPHTVAVNVGRIDSIERVGSELRATGVFDLSTDDGQTAYGKVRDQMLRGVSIDADSIKDSDVEFVWPEDPNGDGESDEPDLFDLLFAQPEKQIYKAGRISAATLCDIPAFAEAYIALTDADGAVTAGGVMDRAEWEAAQREQAELRAVVAHAAAFTPAADWFGNPQLSLPTPITVDASGRIYGHAALFGTCHIGMSGTCVQPPRESYHDYYLTGTVLCEDGVTVRGVGQITVGTGHAGLHADARAAAEHYDNTGTAVADVVTGNDSHGIWVAGCIRADADPAKVAALRASGQVSGDWRPIGGKLRLVALLAVNVPGFPVPRMRARVAGGQQVMALVAAGQPTVAPHTAAVPAVTLSETELDQQAMKRVMNMLARRVNGE